MFQYAAGLALSKRLGSRLYLDLGWFDQAMNMSKVTVRVYELNEFGIKPRRQTYFDRLESFLNPPRVFKEASIDYQEDFRTLSGNIILDGYWQNEKYFKDYSQLISDRFNFIKETGEDVDKLAKKIKNVQAVAVHVRRGDYVTNPSAVELLGVLPQAYYQKAMEIMSSKISAPFFIIFSDDIKWCRQNLKLEHSGYFNSHNFRSWEDMKLMSLCQYHIIANSSFSWWGAWLSPDRDKIVIGPAKWFRDSSKMTSSILPPGWIKL